MYRGEQPTESQVPKAARWMNVIPAADTADDTRPRAATGDSSAVGATPKSKVVKPQTVEELSKKIEELQHRKVDLEKDIKAIQKHKQHGHPDKVDLEARLQEQLDMIDDILPVKQQKLEELQETEKEFQEIADKYLAAQRQSS